MGRHYIRGTEENYQNQDAIAVALIMVTLILEEKRRTETVLSIGLKAIAPKGTDFGISGPNGEWDTRPEVQFVSFDVGDGRRNQFESYLGIIDLDQQAHFDEYVAFLKDSGFKEEYVCEIKHE